MGYISCGEMEDSNSGTPVSMDGITEYTKNFLIVIDDKSLAHSAAICAHPELPKKGAFYRTPLNNYFDEFALMDKSSAQVLNKDDWSKWIATLHYTSRMPSGGPRKQQGQNNPEQDPPSVHWETEVIQKAMPFDLNGRPFNNSATTAYKPAPTMELARPVLVFTRNELTFGPFKIDYWALRFNNRVFMGRPIGTCRCEPPTGEMVFHGNLRYWRVTYRIKLGAVFKMTQKIQIRSKVGNAVTIAQEEYLYERMDVIDLLDEGYMELGVGGPWDGKPVNIKRNGSNITAAVPLDGLGHAINYATVGPNLPEVYNRFLVSQSADLNDLLDGPNLVP